MSTLASGILWSHGIASPKESAVERTLMTRAPSTAEIQMELDMCGISRDTATRTSHGCHDSCG